MPLRIHVCHKARLGNQEMMSSGSSLPSPEQRVGPDSLYRQEKNKGQFTSLRSLTGNLFLYEKVRFKRGFQSHGISLTSFKNGCPRELPRDYGAAENFRRFGVWKLGKDWLRRLRTGVQSTTHAVENMAGYQVPS